MPRCRVNLTTSSNLQASLRRLKRSFPHIAEDLAEIVAKIEADYRNVRPATFCVPMPRRPELQTRVWKYDVPSRDLRRHPRNCVRFVGIFAGGGPPAESDMPVMYGVFCYFKGETQDVQPAEIAREMRQLLLDIEQERERVFYDPT